MDRQSQNDLLGMHPKTPMKIYEVTRSTSGQIGVLVKTGKRNATLLKHCALHSPTGMETGYNGSGPGDLSASILADYFGVSPKRVINVWKKSWGLDDSLALKVIQLHHPFTRHFVSAHRLDPGESYEISDSEIAIWLNDQHDFSAA